MSPCQSWSILKPRAYSQSLMLWRTAHDANIIRKEGTIPSLAITVTATWQIVLFLCCRRQVMDVLHLPWERRHQFVQSSPEFMSLSSPLFTRDVRFCQLHLGGIQYIGRHLDVDMIDNNVGRVFVIERILLIGVIEPKEINSIIRKIDLFPFASCKKIFQTYCQKENQLFSTSIVLYSHDLTGWKQHFKLKRLLIMLIVLLVLLLLAKQ